MCGQGFAQDAAPTATPLLFTDLNGEGRAMCRGEREGEGRGQRREEKEREREGNERR